MLSYRWQFIITLLVKSIILFHAFGGLGHIANNSNVIGLFGGDTPGYLNPIDNLLENGTYEPDGRMPGYGIVYLVFRLAFDRTIACNLLLLLQLILTALSVVALVKTADRLFHNRLFNNILYILLTLSTYNAIWDRYLLTDSFCTSAIVFLCYYIVLYTQQRNVKFLVIAGLLMTWIIFLRPVYAPLAILILGFIILINRRSGKLTQSLLCFALPIMIAESSWIARNYIKYNQVIPFTVMDKVVSKRTKEMWKFVAAYGGNMVYWHPNTEMRWFYQQNADVPPPTIETSLFKKQDLLLLRDALLRYDSLRINDQDQATKLIDSINGTVALYTQAIKKEHHFLYHIQSRIILLKKFLVHSGAYDLYYTPYDQLPQNKKITFSIFSFWHWFTITLGLAGLILVFLKHNKNQLLLLICVLLTYCVFIHPFLRLAEWRYLTPCLPLLTFFASYICWLCISRKQPLIKG